MANRTFKELLTYHLETNPEFEPLKELFKTLQGLTKKERDQKIREWHKQRQVDEKKEHPTK